MNQIVRIWNALGAAQRVSLVVTPLLVLCAVLGVVKWRHQNDFRTLCSGLAPEDAAAVTQKLREASIEFQLDESGASVMVPSESLSEARLALAGAGLPRTGRIGFELFDRMNVGASDFTEQVNYRRALEGELERTVATLSDVAQARVHITFAKESIFLDARQPSKATVVLRLKRAPGVAAPNVTAIANLIASAVDGLTPDAVTIVDSNGRLLNRPRSPQDNDANIAEANLDYRRRVESDFLAKINAAVEPLVGPGKFRAGINIDCDFTSAEENEESYDSARSALLTSQNTEESAAGATAGGVPGTASNLPQPPSRTAGTGTGILRRTESMAYQPGRIMRRTVLPRGSIRRISTTVLVDQFVRWDGAGAKARKSLVPPSSDVMKGIHDVVAGLTGFNEQRGDQIIVETVAFEGSLSAEPPPVAPPPAASGYRFEVGQPVVLAGMAVLILLTGATAMFFLRRPSRRSSDIVQNMTPEALSPVEFSSAVSGAGDPEARLEQQMVENKAEQSQLEAEALSRIKLPPNTKKTDVLVRHIRESVQKDPAGAANVLRTWVTEGEVPARRL